MWPENPKDLVVYGGIGRAARGRDCFDAIVAMLKLAARGVMCHADADYAIAVDCARERGLDLPMIGRG